MISPIAPYIRLPKPKTILKQSNQFISSHSIGISLTKTNTPSNRPKSIISLSKILEEGSKDKLLKNEFLPEKYKSGHENPMINSGKIRWRSPIYKSNERRLLCKQGFHWRLLKHILLQSDHHEKRKMNEEVNYYNGEINPTEFDSIKSDPIPKIIELFGGLNRLSQREKRYLGITLNQSTPIKPLTKSIITTERRSILPKYSKVSLLPKFGVYENRQKVFKGKKRERRRNEKVDEISKRMSAMDLRISNYRKEWRLNKERSRPSLPF